MNRNTKLNSIGESLEACRKAFLICEGLTVKDDLEGRPVLATQEDPEMIDMTKGDTSVAAESDVADGDEEESEAVELTDKAKEILARDESRPSNFMTASLEDTDYICKNGMIVASDYSRAGLLGQVNLISLLSRFEQKGIPGEDYGIIQIGGAFGRYYNFWYNSKNVEAVNALADFEDALDNYPCADDELYSALEDYAVHQYWKDFMSNDEKINYYKKHDEEIDPAWEAEDFEGEIPPPKSFNDNGDLYDRVVTEILSDPELKEAEEQYHIEIPMKYYK